MRLRPNKEITAVVILVLLAHLSECRRVRVKPTVTASPPPIAKEQDDDKQERTRQVLLYAAEESPNEQESQEEDTPVVIGSRQYSSRAGGSGGGSRGGLQSIRLKAESVPRAPPVQTIRNFNKLNDDGSFTFGYEAADGSFKEETRGTDCVVRGKYGYIDPDGNKREFTYVSGNPCDPNAISQEDEETEENKEKSEEENIPQILKRPTFRGASLPLRPKPATTLFEQNFNNVDEGVAEEQDSQLQLNVKQPLRQVYRNHLALAEDETQSQYAQSTIKPRVTYQPQLNSRLIVNRPTTTIEPVTTYRPQVAPLPVYPSSTTLLPKQSPRPAFLSTPSPTTLTYFDEQFKKFQLENNAIPSQAPLSKNIPNNPVYATELVYDPATGQYNTVVYQQVPKSSPVEVGVAKSPYTAITPRPPPRQLLFTSSSTPTPASYQQQLLEQQQQQQQLLQQRQQANQIQQSQQLYNLQVRHQQQPHQQSIVKPHQQPQTIVQRFPPEPKQIQSSAYHPYSHQPFYYLNPALVDERQNLAAGQIDAFLRGHNIPY